MTPNNTFESGRAMKPLNANVEAVKKLKFQKITALKINKL